MTIDEQRRKLLALDARVAEARWQATKMLARIKQLEAAREVHRVEMQRAVVAGP